MSNFLIGFVSTLALFLVLQTAYADVPLNITSEDKAKVIKTLKRNNCTAAKNIDYVDGIGFEAKNVRCSDGKEYNMLLDENFNIASKQ